MLHLLSAVCLLLSATELRSAPVAHENTLLWRIHGGGMKHDSYLYGTVHMRDERAYEFADSVLPALERCHFFAAEQRLDTLVAQMVVEMYDTTAGIRLKDVVQGTQLDSLSALLANKVSVPASMIPNLRCGLVVQLLQNDSDERQGRATFLDAWLLGLARAQKKELKAMEGYAGTLNLFDRLAAYMIRSMLEKSQHPSPLNDMTTAQLMRIYADQRIDSMVQSMEGGGASDEAIMDSLLYLRNQVMFKSFDSLHKCNSLFAAVGAAHLGGDRGLIELLRSKGYTAEPVMPVFTGLRHNYDSIDVSANAEWFEFRSDRNAFSVKMPARLAEAPLYKQQFQSVEMDMPQCYDIISGLQFLAMAMRTGQSANASMSDKMRIADQIAQAYYDSVDSARVRDGDKLSTSYKGMNCFDYSGESKYSSRMKLRIVFSRSTLYALMVLGCKENIGNAMVNSFFSSLDILPAKSQAWETIKDSVNGIWVDMPGHALWQNVGSATSPVELYYNTDMESGNSFVYECNPIGDKIPGATLEQITQEALHKIEREGRTVEGLVFDTVANIDMHCRFRTRRSDSAGSALQEMFIRKRHLYTFQFECADSGLFQRDSSRFFSSIRWQPQPDSAKWQEYRQDSLRISVLFPAKPVFEVMQLNDCESDLPLRFAWQATDPISDRTCSVYGHDVSEYSWMPNADTLLQQWLRPLRVKGDTLMKYSRTDVDNSVIWDFVLGRKQCQLATRYRAVLRGQQFYVASMYLYKGFWDCPEINEFFRSLILPASKGANIGEPKFDRWNKDFESTDSAQHAHAVFALNWMRIAPQDVPKFKQLLQRSHFDDDTLYQRDTDDGMAVGESSGPIRHLIFESLSSYPDSLDLNYLESLYTRSASLPMFRCELLNSLGANTLPGSQSLLLRLLKSDAAVLNKHKAANIGRYLEACQDNMSQLRENRIKLQELYKVEACKSGVLQLLMVLLDSNAITKDEIKIQESELLRDLQRVVKHMSSLSKQRSSGGMVETAPTDAQLQQDAGLAMSLTQWLDVSGFSASFDKDLHELARLCLQDDYRISQDAMRALLRHKRKVSNDILLPLLERRQTRYQTIVLLDSLGLRNRVSAETFKQSSLAIALAQDTDDDESIVDSLEMVGEQILDFRSHKKRFFLLCIHQQSIDVGATSDASQWYYVMVGAFDADSTVLQGNTPILEYSFGVQADRNTKGVSKESKETIDLAWKNCIEQLHGDEAMRETYGVK